MSRSGLAGIGLAGVGLALALAACAGAATPGAAELETSALLVRAEGAEFEVTGYWGPAAGARRRLFLATVDGGREVVGAVYEAWRVESGDLAGDGSDLIVLGVWSERATELEAAPRRTVWVLGLERDERGRLGFVERWRGSALGRPLRDLRVDPGVGVAAATLVALEVSDGACYRTRYRWNGFGFRGERRDAISCDGGF